MIQIRNVPDELHTALKVRAVEAGMSLSDYLTAEMTRLVARRPLAELLEALGESAVILDEGEAARLVREGRAGRS